MVFDSVSWGEVFVMTGLTAVLVGKKDLPVACRFLGTQVGRVVGLLQGARIRADRFAQHHELKALQNELRSGLRELDMVKSEMAMATTNIAGRSLGSTVKSANRRMPLSVTPEVSEQINQRKFTQTKAPVTIPSNLTDTYITKHPFSNMKDLQHDTEASLPLHKLAPRSHSVRAVAEEEWERQGIGFKSRAEQGGDTGSALLSTIIQQSLIHDQYDRAMQEKEETK